MSSHLRQARFGLSLAFAAAALLALAAGLAKAADEKKSGDRDKSAQSEDQEGDQASPKSTSSDQANQSQGNQGQGSKSSRTGQHSTGSKAGDASASTEDNSRKAADRARAARGDRDSENARRADESGQEPTGRDDAPANAPVVENVRREFSLDAEPQRSDRRDDQASESGTRQRQTRNRPQRPSQEDRFQDEDRSFSQNRERASPRTDAGSRSFRGEFGLAFGDAEEGGLSVSRVTGDSLASRAGIRRGDVVVFVNGRRVASDDDFQRWVHRFGPDNEISIVVLRDGHQRTLFADPQWSRFEGSRVDYETADELGYEDDQTRSATRGGAYLGVALDARYPNAALVLEVHADSPADEAGLREGDIIRKVNGQSINSPEELGQAISQMRPGEEAELEYSRRRNSTVGVELGQRPARGAREGEDLRYLEDSYDEQSDDDRSFRNDSNRSRGRSGADEGAELRPDDRGARGDMREDGAGVRVRGQGGPLQRLFRD